MNFKITKLFSLIYLACVFATVLTAQETALLTKVVLSEKQIETNLQLRNATSSKLDSALTYTATGELSSKTLYEYDTNEKLVSELTLDWIDNDWVNASKSTYTYDGEFTNKETRQWENNKWSDRYSILKTAINPKVSFNNDNGGFTFYYPGPYGEVRSVWYGFTGNGWDYYNYKCNPTYDSKGNLTFLEVRYFELANPNNSYLSTNYSISYNDKNQPTLIIGTNENSIEEEKMEYRYNSNGEMVFFEMFYYNESLKQLVILEKYEMINGTAVHMSGSTKTVSKTDNDGNVYTNQFYTLTNNKWYMTHYMIYYPNSLAPTIKPEENNPVDNNNQGGFDIEVNIPTDSINNGNITITLPDGFTLDEENTTLTLDFAGLFDLKITKQENNSWLFEISPKSTKSMLLSGESATEMLHIAYNVDETLVRGIYDITINNILFETKGGSLIPEPAITVPVSVNRWGVDNEYVNNTKATVYMNNNTLYIQSTQAETIAVYAPTGIKLYDAKIQSGATTINIANFPKGVLIVRGSSGWTKKVVL